MARVMYFESIRSSDEGMLAVGTVVMNRLQSDKYPNTVCGVVGEKNQFAPGVLSRPMQEGKSRERAYRMADQVLRGKRHRSVGKAMFFHTAGRTYKFTNMHYVAVAGGNAFYERKPTEGKRYIPRTMIASAGPRDSIGTTGWGFFGGTGAVAQVPRPVERVYASAEPAPPQPRPAAAARRPQPAYAPPPAYPLPPEIAPGSIEALILASNGF
jgi:hypothetical protein